MSRMEGFHLAAALAGALVSGCAVSPTQQSIEPDVAVTVNALGAVRQNDPDSALQRERLGRRYLAQQNLALAEASLSSALELEPDRFGALMAIGVLYDQQERHVDARAAFERASSVAPSRPEPINNIGYSWYLEGRLEQAEAALLRALAIDRDFERARANLALVHAVAGDRSAALEQFERLGSTQQAYNNSGYLNLLLNREDVARDALLASRDASGEYYGPARRNLTILGRSPADRRVVDDRTRLGVDDVPRRFAALSRPAIETPATVGSQWASILIDDGADASSDGQSGASKEIESVDAVVAVNDDADALAGTPDTPSVVTESVEPSGSLPDPGIEIDDLPTNIVRDLQTQLNERGLDAGNVDGQLGPKTVQALRMFKVARRLPVDSTVTTRLLAELGIDPSK